MFRLDAVNHVIRAVQRVTEGVLVGCCMQSFNHSWKKKERHDHKLHNPMMMAGKFSH